MPTAPKRDPTYTIDALHQALRVLDTFLLHGRDSVRLAELSRELGLNKSRVFRIAATLEQHGYLAQDPATRAYRLGLKCIELGQAARRHLSLLDAADPVLTDLAEHTGETVFLGVRDGLEAVCVAMRESRHSVRLTAEIGRRVPLYVGGIPKMLLAMLPPPEQEEVVGRLRLVPITAKTITSRSELRRQVAAIRAQGYVVTADDLDLGATSVAAPVFGPAGELIAGLSVAGPTERFTPQFVDRAVRLTLAAADRIRVALGGAAAARAHATPVGRP